MYPMKITRKKVAVMLANIWTWPALISYLPIFLGWYIFIYINSSYSSNIEEFLQSYCGSIILAGRRSSNFGKCLARAFSGRTDGDDKSLVNVND